MNIVVVSTHILMASHYETELEIILQHQQNGDRITQLVCNKELPSCDVNPYHHQEACERCVSKRLNGYKVLNSGLNVKSFFNLTSENKKVISKIKTNYKSVVDLQSLWIDNYDIGFAIASSIISENRNPNPVLEPRLLERYIVSSAGVYFSMLNYLNQNPTDLVYAFNGRVAHTKAVLRACNKLGVKCLLHERGNSVNFYSLSENTTIHDIKNTHRLIEESWEKAESHERERIAEDWYNTRIAGKMQNWFSFLADQLHELPEDWDFSKRNILICNSSEDELASLGEEWKNPLYINQLDGIKKILDDSAALENTHFYLRIHPHLSKVNNPYIQELSNLSAPHLTIIPANSKISTYHLVSKSEKIITFGSTIGMEATFMRKPSICAGKSFYYHLNGTHIPQNHDDLIRMINANLEPKPLEEALKYAYFFATFGVKFKFYKPEDFDKGTISGIKIEPNYGIKYQLINYIYHNKLFSGLSEKLRIRNRENIYKRYLS